MDNTQDSKTTTLWSLIATLQASLESAGLDSSRADKAVTLFFKKNLQLLA